MKREYQIIKKYYRNDHTGKVGEYYQVQYLGYKFSILFFPRKLAWKPCKRWTPGWGGDAWMENANFDTKEEAMEYMKNLQTPVYADELIARNDKII